MEKASLSKGLAVIVIFAMVMFMFGCGETKQYESESIYYKAFSTYLEDEPSEGSWSVDCASIPYTVYNTRFVGYSDNNGYTFLTKVDENSNIQFVLDEPRTNGIETE